MVTRHYIERIDGEFSQGYRILCSKEVWTKVLVKPNEAIAMMEGKGTCESCILLHMANPEKTLFN